MPVRTAEAGWAPGLGFATCTLNRSRPAREDLPGPAGGGRQGAPAPRAAGAAASGRRALGGAKLGDRLAGSGQSEIRKANVLKEAQGQALGVGSLDDGTGAWDAACNQV